MKKMLVVFAFIVFLVALVLAFYFGITLAKEIVIVTSPITGTPSTQEKINFGTFLIYFLKYIAIGLFGGGMLLAAANKVNDY